VYIEQGHQSKEGITIGADIFSRILFMKGATDPLKKQEKKV
jgi:hypothetical protein